ncbi:glycosyltransferase family 2 protein [Winogradskyella ouciana]|uniref:Glycosyltransferase n=1 Tax=Winogradskyella ouciana TaxID=2608631 RepID=A0A7K1GED1_9FLAO|nr:glycosyltransferase [Winogradskyella ouciana]MTE26768.1 glycosyltransferase [Winogradskyella ouciana]
MLSILIPVYNYNILPLVEEVHAQAIKCHIKFEIIVIDDASDIRFDSTEKVKAFSNIKLIVLKENIGRSAIRNLLANKAQYNTLLFIDAGTFPKSKEYIASYIEHKEKDVVIGGMIGEKVAAKKPYKLRWIYTKERESHKSNKVLSSANFLIKKSVILKCPFNESIKTYGYEDLLFFNTLKAEGIKPSFIDTPVIHDSKEDADTFIKKTEQGLQNLHHLVKSNEKLIQDSSVVKYSNKINSLKLSGLVIMLFILTKPLLLKNLKSSYPSMRLFDFYKLGYFCKLKQKH